MTEKISSNLITEYGHIRTLFAPNNMIEELQSISKELQPLFRLDRKVKRTQIKILQYLCENPGDTVYEIYKKRSLGEDADIRTLRRYVQDLLEKGLIQRFQKDNSEHKAKPCINTLAGIVYLILTKNVLYKSIIKEIFRNYGNNNLFNISIYPYLKQETVLQLTTFNSLSPISSFLTECCIIIEQDLKSINNAKATHIMERIFAWKQIPKNENETNRLLQFLKRRFNLNWIDHAKIEKINGDNTIRLSSSSKSILIILNDTKTMTILKIMGENERREEFVVEANSDDYDILALCESIEEFQAKSILISIHERIHSLVFNLISNGIAGSQDFQILSQDKRFMRVLKKAKTKLDNQYKMITSAKAPSSTFSS